MARRDDDDVIVQPQSDAYVGLLAISLGAMIVGCALLFWDYASYPEKQPPKPPAPVAAKSLEGP